MSEFCSYHLMVTGTKGQVEAFMSILGNAKRNAKEGSHLPVIAFANQDEFPDIHDAEEVDGYWRAEAWGTSYGSPLKMIDESITLDDGYIHITDAVRETGVELELFANNWLTWESADYHVIVAPDGSVVKSEESWSLHEYIQDTFDDEEEALDAASSALEDMGLEPTINNLRKFIDDEGYIDISAISWEFSIPLQNAS